MRKRGVTLAMRAIIIAILLLVVAAVVIGLFISRMSLSAKKAESCLLQGGRCKTDCGEDREIEGKCPEGQKCCVSFEEE